jgi:hypothetical protein
VAGTASEWPSSRIFRRQHRRVGADLGASRAPDRERADAGHDQGTPLLTCILARLTHQSPRATTGSIASMTRSHAPPAGEALCAPAGGRLGARVRRSLERHRSLSRCTPVRAALDRCTPVHGWMRDLLLRCIPSRCCFFARRRRDCDGDSSSSSLSGAPRVGHPRAECAAHPGARQRTPSAADARGPPGAGAGLRTFVADSLQSDTHLPRLSTTWVHYLDSSGVGTR